MISILVQIFYKHSTVRHFIPQDLKKNSLQDITQNIIECFTIKQDVTHVVIPVPYAQSLDLATVEENQISVEQSWQKIFSQIITLASFLEANNLKGKW